MNDGVRSRGKSSCAARVLGNQRFDKYNTRRHKRARILKGEKKDKSLRDILARPVLKWFRSRLPRREGVACILHPFLQVRRISIWSVVGFFLPRPVRCREVAHVS